MTTISSIDARYAQVQVGEASKKVAASVQNLVSGNKTNAGVADLSVGTVLSSRVNTLRVAVGNAGQAKSLLETAKGGLNTILGLLQQQKSLATKSSDDSLGDNERGFLNQEFQALVSEIDRIADTANFNGKALLDGSISGAATVATATGLSAENYGTISAGDLALRGTVATGDLITTESKAGVNKVMITTNGVSAAAGVFTITDEADGTSAAVSFTFGATIDLTIDAIVTAFNSFSGTNAKTVQNFKLINNGDSSFTIQAKEAGTHLNSFEFQFTTASTLAATMGQDAAGTNVVAGTPDFNTDTSLDSTPYYARGVDGTFATVASYNVGQTTGVARLINTTAVNSEAVTLTITDTNGVVVQAGGTVTIAITNDGSATEEEWVNDLLDVINGGDGLVGTSGAIAGSAAIDGDTTAGRLALLRNFVFEKSDGQSSTLAAVDIKSAKAGTYLDGVTFLITSAAGVFTFNGSDVDSTGGAAVAFMGGTEIVTSADRAVATTAATVDDNLKGALTNFGAVFTQGQGDITDSTNGGIITRNYVNFSVDVGSKTYISEKVYLHGGAGLTTIGQYGNTIAAGQVITFFDPDGPRDASGIYTDNAFSLRMGSTARTLADMTSAALAQQSVNIIADSWETQLASVTIDQNRSLAFAQEDASSGDHRIAKAIRTVLAGLRGFDSVGTNTANYNSGDVTLSTSDYSATGTLGNIGKFNVDRLTGRITTTIDNVVYTAYLSSNDLPSTGNVVAFGTNLNGTSNIGSYDATTKILNLKDASASTSAISVEGTAKFHFFSASTTDGRVLTIDLGNVADNTAQININSDSGELALEDAFNEVFGVASNESLNFQVGNAADDTIGVSIAGTKTTDVYLNDAGTATVLSVATITQAVIASDVLDNAINNVVTRISNVSAKISSFNSSIQNNQTSIQNADAARSKLLDTDYTEESTMFAESRVRVDAATAVLAQINTRAQNLLQLLRQ